MTFEEGDFLVGFWFVTRADEKGDWMASVTKKAGQDSYVIETRFREYKDNRFDEFSEDEKRWSCFRSGPSETEEGVIAKIGTVAQLLEESGYGRAERPFLVRAWGKDAADVITKQAPPWMHVNKRETV